jgi:hypothetical protein
MAEWCAWLYVRFTIIQNSAPTRIAIMIFCMKPMTPQVFTLREAHTSAGRILAMRRLREFRESIE